MDALECKVNWAQVVKQQDRNDHGTHSRSDGPFPGLAGADPWSQLCPAKCPSDVVGGDIARPDKQQGEKQEQRAVGLGAHQNHGGERGSDIG